MRMNRPHDLSESKRVLPASEREKAQLLAMYEEAHERSGESHRVWCEARDKADHLDRCLKTWRGKARDAREHMEKMSNLDEDEIEVMQLRPWVNRIISEVSSIQAELDAAQAYESECMRINDGRQSLSIALMIVMNCADV